MMSDYFNKCFFIGYRLFFKYTAMVSTQVHLHFCCLANQHDRLDKSISDSHSYKPRNLSKLRHYWCSPWWFDGLYRIWHHSSSTPDSCGEVGSYLRRTGLVLVQNPGKLVRLTARHYMTEILLKKTALNPNK